MSQKKNHLKQSKYCTPLPAQQERNDRLFMDSEVKHTGQRAIYSLPRSRLQGDYCENLIFLGFVTSARKVDCLH